MTQKITLIYFSPTGTTENILKAVAAGLSPEEPVYIDASKPAIRENTYSFKHDELVIIGIPVYAGRVPETVLPFLSELQGDNTQAVLIAVYGNRAFEDALLELKDITASRGFQAIAAGAFIGQHSYSTKDHPIAPGRPDEKDLTTARSFGKKIKEILSGEVFSLHDGPLDVPGNTPYRERSKFPQGNITTRYELCSHCGTCAEVCPTGAVSEEHFTHDPEKCIICCACIRFCPGNARTLETEAIHGFSVKLSKMCADRKDPEFFF